MNTRRTKKRTSQEIKTRDSDDEKEHTKQMKPNSDSDGNSSDSSVGNYLKTADEIDLNSSFFKVNDPDSFNDIEKRMFADVQRLSESEDSDEQTNIKQEPSPRLNFERLHEYNKKMEEAKACVENYRSKVTKPTDENKLDILHLLSLGEHKDVDPQIEDNEDSGDEMDWQEVEEWEVEEEQKKPQKDVEITVALPTTMRQKKQIDLMASIKRQINQVKKQNQVFIHKVHLLCWIAHGNYVNSVLNNENLLGLALSLLPSEQCYPPKHADLKYMEMVTKWFSKAIKIVEEPPGETIKLIPLFKSLKPQLQKKQAKSKRDFVLMFICILRSLGLQCRLVLSLQVLPLRPPSSELCSLSTKEKTKKTTQVQSGPVASTSKADTKPLKTVKQPEKSPPKIKQKSNTQTKSKTVTKETKTKSASDKLNGPETSENKSEKKPNKLNLKKLMEEPQEVNNKQTKGKTTKKTKEKPEEPTNKDSKPRRSTGKKREVKQEKGKIPQLDGADDETPSTSKPRVSRVNLSKLKKNGETKASSPDVCLSKRHPRKSKSVAPKYMETDSDNDFKPSKSTKNSQTNQRTKKPSGDVKNDIINIMKDRMLEQKHTDQAKLVKKKESGSDSDYAPEPIVKKGTKLKKFSSEEDFDLKANAKLKKRIKPIKENDNRVLSTDSDELTEKKKKVGLDIWVEVFLEAEEKWISVDVVKGQIHCVSEIHSRASQPVSYILAWNNNFSVKDVTARYCSKWNTVTRKLRVDVQWWHDTLKPYEGKKNARDREEDEDLFKQQLDKPLPTTIGEYKNHPLYALKRHLLKFEAIYPPNAVTLGFVRNEPVYSRDCVHTLHSRDIWVKHAKVVKPGEKPYKIVKARPKYDKLSGTCIADIPLEIFGKWQVQDYEPPTAENGVVPRNAFGNVEMFKACMLPKNTVHLKLPGLNKVARKLQIDCAPAVVGFDFHSGFSHPTFDGFVVCKEFKDTLEAAWEQEQEDAEKREQEKYEKRVYGNWRRLIKAALIRERLKARYDFGEPEAKAGKKKKSRGPRFVAKKRRVCSASESSSD